MLLNIQELLAHALDILRKSWSTFISSGTESSGAILLMIIKSKFQLHLNMQLSLWLKLFSCGLPCLVSIFISHWALCKALCWSKTSFKGSGCFSSYSNLFIFSSRTRKSIFKSFSWQLNPKCLSEKPKLSSSPRTLSSSNYWISIRPVYQDSDIL